MSDSLLLPLAMVVGPVIGGFCFFKCIANLATALRLLILVVVFGGIVSVNLGSGAYAILFRDVFIVLPLYLGVFTSDAGWQAMTRIPVDLVFALGFFMLVVLISFLNSVGEPIVEIGIGLKVWLYYGPFLVVGIALARQPDLMVGLFRQVLFWGGIACAVGLLQSLLVRILGYEAAMRLFFGSYASHVTQEFAYFSRAGGIYRIPATFSFASQFGGFLHLYLTVAVIAANYDPEMRIQRIARVAVFVALLAGVLSGTREVIVVFPAMLVAYAVFGVLKGRLLLFAPIGIAAVGGVLALASVDPIAYFRFGGELAMGYTNDFIFDQISDSLNFGVIGAGIGASTSAARYAFGATGIDDSSQLLFESYFAKAAGELGWLGFAALIIVFLVIAVRVAVTVRANIQYRENAIIVPIAVYVAYTISMSLKGAVLDIDPGNIFFWLLLGLLIGVDRVREGATSPHEQEIYDQHETEAYDLP